MPDGRPAEKILEALLEDWRRHLRDGPPLDDTTVLVLRRSAAERAADEAEPALSLALAGGLAPFALGVALAFAFLPEWRAARPAAPELYEREFRRIAARSGLPLAPGRPVAGLTTGSGDSEDAYRSFGEATAGWLKAQSNQILVRLRQGVRRPGARDRPGAQGGVHARRAPLADLLGEHVRNDLPAHRPRPVRAPGRRFASLLVAPGESLGPPVREPWRAASPPGR